MNKVVLTFDLDWCSDEVLQYTLGKLIEEKVPATFFVTHDTSLLHEIRKYNFFELGIHPNFNRNTTHGTSVDEIIDHCLKIVPEAISSRSHGLKISSDKLITMMKKGIKIDCSIFMPDVKKMESFYFKINENKILRIPYNWEDDYEFYQENKKYTYNELATFDDKILDFHPIHVQLNSSSDTLYNQYKQSGKIVRNPNIGAETMLDEVISEYKMKNIEVQNLKSYLGLK